MAANISYISTNYKFLPITYFESGRRLCIKTAIHHLLKKYILFKTKIKLYP